MSKITNDNGTVSINEPTQLLAKLPLALISQIEKLREVRDYLREYAKTVHYKNTATHSALNEAEEQLNELVYIINAIVNASIENELYFDDYENKRGKECA